MVTQKGLQVNSVKKKYYLRQIEQIPLIENW